MKPLSPDSVNSHAELTDLLKQLRMIQVDDMSYESMAKSLNLGISRSELGRIFTGKDFPTWRQLEMIIGVLKVDATDHEAWKSMWDRLRLAQRRQSTPPRQIPQNPSDERLTSPRFSMEDLTPVASGEMWRPPADDDSNERARRTAASIVEDAQAEAHRIVKAAYDTADEQRQMLLNQAQSLASDIVLRALTEQAAILQAAERRFTSVVATVEEKLHKIAVDLNDSIESTSRTTDELRELMSEARSSVTHIRDELTHLKEETNELKQRFQTLGKDEPLGGDPEVDITVTGSSDIFMDDRDTTPPVLGHPAPDYGAPMWPSQEAPWQSSGPQRQSSEPPWLAMGG